MRIGTSITLIIVGGILAAAIEFDIPVIDLGALGSILFIMGLLGLVFTVGLELAENRQRRPRRQRRRDKVEPEPTRRRPEPTYDPVLPQRPRSPRSPRRPPSASEDPTRVAPQRREP
ncbi:MAG: hypothetical protein M3R46_11720 [Actinomycetota bacterium]|nr:hypothetical protein [Actinomycetota bacterium]MDQ3410176.1 hypothetical protein [Actinomycetota bacterium]